MIIIGGDRHKVTFNDAYFFKLNKGVETLPYYDWFPPFYSTKYVCSLSIRCRWQKYAYQGSDASLKTATLALIADKRVSSIYLFLSIISDGLSKL